MSIEKGFLDDKTAFVVLHVTEGVRVASGDGRAARVKE